MAGNDACARACFFIDIMNIHAYGFSPSDVMCTASFVADQSQRDLSDHVTSQLMR